MHMQFIKILNQVAAFSLELFMLASLAYSGFQIGKTTAWKYGLAVGLPVIVMILWGLFAAPKANYRLEPGYRFVFELGLFLVSAVLLYKTGQEKTALVFGGIAVLSQVAALVMEQ
jgi:hypothetical protein